MSVLVLADVKTHLNMLGTSSDAELQTFLDAAEGAIVKRVGPLASTAYTDRVVGGGSTLLLPHSPALTLTSVTPVGGSAADLTQLWLNPAGVVEFAKGDGYFAANRYDVAYTAGRASVPADLAYAVKETVRHLWDTQRGGSRRPGMAEDASVMAGAAYAFTARIREMWEPYLQAGMA